MELAERVLSLLPQSIRLPDSEEPRNLNYSIDDSTLKPADHGSPEGSFSATVHCNLYSEAECKVWKEAFEIASATQYNFHRRNSKVKRNWMNNQAK